MVDASCVCSHFVCRSAMHVVAGRRPAAQVACPWVMCVNPECSVARLDVPNSVSQRCRGIHRLLRRAALARPLRLQPLTDAGHGSPGPIQNNTAKPTQTPPCTRYTTGSTQRLLRAAEQLTGSATPGGSIAGCRRRHHSRINKGMLGKWALLRLDCLEEPEESIARVFYLKKCPTHSFGSNDFAPGVDLLLHSHTGGPHWTWRRCLCPQPGSLQQGIGVEHSQGLAVANCSVVTANPCECSTPMPCWSEPGCGQRHSRQVQCGPPVWL